MLIIIIMLISRIITLELSQHIRSRYVNVINVTDGQTDGRMDDIRS